MQPSKQLSNQTTNQPNIYIISKVPYRESPVLHEVVGVIKRAADWVKPHPGQFSRYAVQSVTVNGGRLTHGHGNLHVVHNVGPRFGCGDTKNCAYKWMTLCKDGFYYLFVDNLCRCSLLMSLETGLGFNYFIHK